MSMMMKCKNEYTQFKMDFVNPTFHKWFYISTLHDETKEQVCLLLKWSPWVQSQPHEIKHGHVNLTKSNLYKSVIHQKKHLKSWGCVQLPTWAYRKIWPLVLAMMMKSFKWVIQYYKYLEQKISISCTWL